MVRVGYRAAAPVSETDPSQPPPADDTSARAVAGARRVAASSAIQAVGEAGSKVAMLALYAVMARAVGPDDFGDFVSASSLALLVLVAAFGVDFTTTKLVARGDTAASAAFWNSLLIKAALGMVLVASVTGVALVGGYSRQTAIATAVLGLATIVELLSGSVYAVFRGVERTGPIAQAQLLQRFSIALGGTVALCLGAGVAAVAGIWLAGGLLGLLFVGVRAGRIGVIEPGRPGRRGARDLLRDSFGLGLSSLFGAALSRLDVIILGLLKPSAAVALYGAAYRVFESSLIVVATFGLATFPLLARLGNGAPDALAGVFGRLLKVVLVMTAPLALGMALFAAPIVDLLYGDGFAGAAAVMRILAPSIVLTGIFGLCCNVLAAQGRQREIIAGLSAGAVANAGLNLALVPAHGARGAAVAMTVSMLVAGGVLAVMVRRTTGALAIGRVATGPVVATLAGAVAAELVPPDALGIVALGVAYAVALVLVERRVAPADVALAGQVLRRRGATA